MTDNDQIFFLIAVSVIISTILGIVSNIVANSIQPHLERRKKLLISLLISCVVCSIIVTSFLELGTPPLVKRLLSSIGGNEAPSNNHSEVATAEPALTTSPSNTPSRLASTPSPTTSPSLASTPTPDAVVVVESLNMRSGPGKMYSRSNSYPKGTNLVILGKDEMGTWLYVRASDGLIGWMSMSNLQVNIPLTNVAIATAPPLPTEQPQPTAQIAERVTTLPPVPTALPAQVLPTPALQNCGSYVDLGNAQSEKGHDLTGWGGAWRDQPQSPSGDTTFQYQSIRGEASLVLCVSELNMNYLFMAEVQDFGCDDSFDIYINDSATPALSFSGTRSNIIRTHKFTIPADQITPSVIVTFRNRSTDCGAAGVYNVALQKE